MNILFAKDACDSMNMYSFVTLDKRNHSEKKKIID